MEKVEHELMLLIGAHTALRHVVQNLCSVLLIKEALTTTELRVIVSSAAELCEFQGTSPEQSVALERGAFQLLTSLSAAYEQKGSGQGGQ